MPSPRDRGHLVPPSMLAVLSTPVVDAIEVYIVASNAPGAQLRPRAPPKVGRSPKIDARMLPDLNWNALCHVSCSALLGGRLPTSLGLDIEDEGGQVEE